jgi:hypothetical protein
MGKASRIIKNIRVPTQFCRHRARDGVKTALGVFIYVSPYPGFRSFVKPAAL